MSDACDTGFVYYGRRYYSPSQGRFLGRDPIEEKGGNNLYAFAFNDSINNWDKNGCLPVLGFLIGGGLDLGVQLLLNGGNWSQVSWGSVGVSAVSTAAGVGLLSVGQKVFTSVRAIQVATDPKTRTIWSVSRGSVNGIPATTVVRQEIVDTAVGDIVRSVALASSVQVTKVLVQSAGTSSNDGQTPPSSSTPVITPAPVPATVPGLGSINTGGGTLGNVSFVHSTGSHQLNTLGNEAFGPAVVMAPFEVNETVAAGTIMNISGSVSGVTNTIGATNVSTGFGSPNVVIENPSESNFFQPVVHVLLTGHDYSGGGGARDDGPLY